MGIIKKVFSRSVKNLALPAPSGTHESTAQLRARLIGEKFTKAVFGDKCRTAIFRDTNMLDDYKFYQAQAVTADQSRWNIMLVTDREQIVEGVVKRVRHFTPQAESLDFFEAIEYLARHEENIKAHQGRALDEDALNAQGFTGLSVPHFRPFAEREGILFTIENMPEPSLNGAIVIPGAYDQNALRVEDQVNKGLALNESWTKSILEFTDQRLNSKAPFDMIVSTREDDKFYHQSARLLNWMIEMLDMRLATTDFYVPKDVAIEKTKEIENIGSIFMLDLIIPTNGIYRYLRVQNLPGITEAVKTLPLYAQIDNMATLLSLLELIAHYKMSGHQKPARDVGKEIEQYGQKLKFSAPEIETLKAFMLTDAKVVIPPHVRQFSAQLTQFADQHTKLLAAMEQELLQPDAKIGQDRMQDYVKGHPQRMLEVANFTFTAETLESKNKAAVAYVKEQNNLSQKPRGIGIHI